MAKREVLEAVEALLNLAENSGLEDDWWADRMEVVYHWLHDEWDEKTVEKFIRAAERDARADGKRLADRRGYRRQVLELAKKNRKPYDKWKYREVA